MSYPVRAGKYREFPECQAPKLGHIVELWAGGACRSLARLDAIAPLFFRRNFSARVAIINEDPILPGTPEHAARRVSCRTARVM